MVGNLPAPPLDEGGSGDIGYASILPLVRTFIADAGSGPEKHLPWVRYIYDVNDVVDTG